MKNLHYVMYSAIFVLVAMSIRVLLYSGDISYVLFSNDFSTQTIVSLFFHQIFFKFCNFYSYLINTFNYIPALILFWGCARVLFMPLEIFSYGIRYRRSLHDWDVVKIKSSTIDSTQKTQQIKNLYKDIGFSLNHVIFITVSKIAYYLIFIAIVRTQFYLEPDFIVFNTVIINATMGLLFFVLFYLSARYDLSKPSNLRVYITSFALYLLSVFIFNFTFLVFMLISQLFNYLANYIGHYLFIVQKEKVPHEKYC
jgi:hypothetical protein